MLHLCFKVQSEKQKSCYCITKDISPMMLSKFTKGKKLSSRIKQSQITCLEHHAIEIETHASMSHPIRALCPSVL